MNRKQIGALAGFVLTVLACTQASAQGSFSLYDTNSGNPVVFTNLVGTVTTNGLLIVFEGELESLVSVPKAYNLTSDRYLASIQLLTQIRLFDELPESNEVETVQGAVAALRDGVGSSNGTYYVWAVTNVGVSGWTPLLSTNEPPTTFPVTDGETNYVTFVFSYPTNGNPVTYQVYLGGPSDTTMIPSASVT